MAKGVKSKTDSVELRTRAADPNAAVTWERIADIPATPAGQGLGVMDDSDPLIFVGLPDVSGLDTSNAVVLQDTIEALLLNLAQVAVKYNALRLELIDKGYMTEAIS